MLVRTFKIHFEMLASSILSMAQLSFYLKHGNYLESQSQMQIELATQNLRL